MPSLLEILNRFSFVIFAGLGWLLLAVWLIRRGRRGWLALGALTVGLGLSWALQRPGAGATPAELEAALQSGQPVLVEYYSEY